MRIQVLIDVPRLDGSGPYTYSVPAALREKVEVGKRVLVPVGRQILRGFVDQIETGHDIIGLKSVIEVLDQEPLLTREMLELAKWLSVHCLAPLGRTLKAMYPAALEGSEGEFLVAGKPDPDQVVHEVLGQKSRTTWQEAVQRTSAGELTNLLASGQLKLESSPSLDPHPPGMQYRLACQIDEKTLIRLGKRAPRQSRALQFFEAQKVVGERMALAEVGATVLQALVDKGFLVREPAPPRVVQYPLPSHDQAIAIKSVAAAMEQGRFAPFLLFGVTGSGKTEVYIRLVEKAREMGKQSLILIPEIGLTEQIISVFSERLGGICVLHSRLSSKERVWEWSRVRKGDADVVIGARSAVFAPCERLGLIIMDEEQEYSFRQEDTPRYHAREVALWRAQKNKAVLLLGSATPSVESYQRAMEGEYHLLSLPEKMGDTGKRSIELVDVRKEFRKGNPGSISGMLIKALKDCLNQGEQAVLLINRRGYATTVVCQECGQVLTCRACEVSLNYHRDIEKLTCHYCGYQSALVKQCPNCRGKQMRLLGLGTQRVEEELKGLLPEARVIRMDADSTRGRDGHRRIIEAIKTHKADVVVGTQMVAKGFDFPNVSLVGVINADPMLGLPDFRAQERAFGLLVQVAGRAGRGATGGRVLIQTYDPDQPFFDLVKNEDYPDFFREEITFRRLLGYPPFTHLIKLLFSGSDEQEVHQEAVLAQVLIEEMIGELAEEINILGPAPCLQRKIAHRFRFQMIVKGTNLDLMREVSRYIIENRKSKRVRIDVDVDPLVMI